MPVDSGSNSSPSDRQDEEASGKLVEMPDRAGEIAESIILRVLEAPIVNDLREEFKNRDKSGATAQCLKVDILKDEILQICSHITDCFIRQPTLLTFEKTLPIYVVADLHGNILHLLRIFRSLGTFQTNTYLFLGDYVDRGAQGIEIMMFLFCLKIRYPNQIYLLRGNHEDVNATLSYGFYDEILTKFGTDGGTIYRTFLEVFNHLPMAALISEKIFCCHGGISPFMDRVQDVNKIRRPAIIPPYGLACDLVWADPAINADHWTLSHRGISFVFGNRQMDDFCEKNNIKLVIRGHQISSDMYKCGYKVLLSGRLITLFSSSNYMNYRNNSAVVEVTKKLKVVFHVFRSKTSKPPAKPKKKKKTRKARGSAEIIACEESNSNSVEADIDTSADSKGSNRPTNPSAESPDGRANKKR